MARQRIEIPPALVARAVDEAWSLTDIAREIRRTASIAVSVSTVRARLGEIGVVLHTQFAPAGRRAVDLHRGPRHHATGKGPTWTRACLRCEATVTLPRHRFLCDGCWAINRGGGLVYMQPPMNANGREVGGAA